MGMTCQTSLVMVLCRLEVTLLIFPLHADDCGEIQSDIPGDAAAVEEEEVRKKNDFLHILTIILVRRVLACFIWTRRKMEMKRRGLVEKDGEMVLM